MVISNKVINRFGKNLSGFTFSVWGLSFKPETDDMREAPSIYVIKELIERGAKINAYDPQAINGAQTYYLKGLDVKYFESKYDACKDADALVILTEWKEFRSPDFQKLSSQLKNKIIFDGRNIYNGVELENREWEYHQIGKAFKIKEMQS